MMAYSTDSKSAAVRAQLDHPVIDGDGHWLEPVPIFLDYLREVAGPTVVERFRKMATAHIDRGWYDMTPAERLDRRPTRPTWWGEPANTLDRATAMIPKLFYERLDDFGIDFAMLYTSLGLFHIANPDEELRRAIARAVNKMNAEMFRPYAHRIAPAAVVPVHTPQEAIDEATYAVRELGLKVIMIANHVRRPVPAFARQASDPTQVRQFVDSLAYESAYDYDPLWAKCVELKVAVTAHSGSMGWMGRESVNSFVFNHIGHFATASHAFAKALILGGVVHRFPTLRFAMLEGGVGWACNLITDLLGHWDKRNGRAMEAHTRPTNLDKQGLKDLFTRFGGRVYEEKMDELMNCLSLVPPFKSAEEMTEREYREQLDDFAAAHVTSADELRRQFTDHFYFGCEADDPTTAWAFDRRGNHRLNPIFSSDVGHFDVTDMSEVLEEAHELVEHGLITMADFREFVFGNAARLHTALNPDFFKGTVVESAVAQELAR
jgi:predicted TIM-barrel fold metal-dependent hydrolase